MTSQKGEEGGIYGGSDLASRIVIYFVANHNDFFEHYCVARY